MDVVKRIRRPMRAQLTKMINEIDLELIKANIDNNAVRVKLDMIMKCFEQIDELDRKLWP